LSEKAKEKSGRLTDDDWKMVDGKRDQLVDKIQERYGITRGAERQMGDFAKRPTAGPRLPLMTVSAYVSTEGPEGGNCGTAGADTQLAFSARRNDVPVGDCLR
jgi:uncharacterized protein YjbJ (UPF0337 family)